MKKSQLLLTCIHNVFTYTHTLYIYIHMHTYIYIHIYIKIEWFTRNIWTYFQITYKTLSPAHKSCAEKRSVGLLPARACMHTYRHQKISRRGKISGLRASNQTQHLLAVVTCPAQYIYIYIYTRTHTSHFVYTSKL